MAELNKGIRREVTRLSERWSALLLHAHQWKTKLDDMLPVSKTRMQSVLTFASLKHYFYSFLSDYIFCSD